jgi:glycosyltransferase involved in cell wall biosynthesis
MTSGQRRFSIVVPTYNRAALIARTLESIFRLNYENYEVIVVDDGSRDNTEEVVASFKDPRLTYHAKENAERGAARNYGAARATGDYINFFDSDDLMYPDHLEKANSLVGNAPELLHLAYDCRLPDGTLLHKVNNFDDSVTKLLLFDNKLSCNGVFLRRDVANKFRFHEERDLASSEDWELWLRLICRFPIKYCNDVTSSVIFHDQRSLFTIAADKVVKRDLLLIDKLKEDQVVMNRYGRSFSRFMAERYTFFMLGFSQQRNKAEVFKWAMEAAKVYPPIVFSKRFLASIKNVF